MKKAVLFALIVLPIAGVAAVGWRTYEGYLANRQQTELNYRKQLAGVCGDWISDPEKRLVCADAYEIWRNCRAHLQKVEYDSGLDTGVVCEHPVFLFNTRLEQQLTDAMRSINGEKNP